jgi:hypothetical protein
MKAASDFGISLSPEFYSFAPQAARAWFEHPEAVTQVVIRHYLPERRTVISYNDEVMKQPPTPGWILSFCFELRSIFEAALSALEAETEREPKRHATVVAEPSTPLLKAIGHRSG